MKNTSILHWYMQGIRNLLRKITKSKSFKIFPVRFAYKSKNRLTRLQDIYYGRLSSDDEKINSKPHTKPIDLKNKRF